MAIKILAARVFYRANQIKAVICRSSFTLLCATLGVIGVMRSGEAAPLSYVAVIAIGNTHHADIVVSGMSSEPETRATAKAIQADYSSEASGSMKVATNIVGSAQAGPMKLVGIIIGPDEKTVLFSLPNGQCLELTQGESLLGERIVSIENQEVIVAFAGNLVALRPDSGDVPKSDVASDIPATAEMGFPPQKMEPERRLHAGRMSHRNARAMPVGPAG